MPLRGDVSVQRLVDPGPVLHAPPMPHSNRLLLPQYLPQPNEQHMHHRGNHQLGNDEPSAHELL